MGRCEGLIRNNISLRRVAINKAPSRNHGYGTARTKLQLDGGETELRTIVPL